MTRKQQQFNRGGRLFDFHILRFHHLASFRADIRLCLQQSGGHGHEGGGGGRFWGLSVSANPFYMFPRSVSLKNHVILGSRFGLIVDWAAEMQTSLSSQHGDVERSLRYLHSNNVPARFQGYAVLSRY